MMVAIKQYLLSVVAVSIIISILTKLISAKSPHKQIIQTIGGVFIVLTFLTPLTNISLDDSMLNFDSLSADAKKEIDIGTRSANTAIREVIKQRVESYILEKAASMGTEIHAEVTLSNQEQPLPVSIEISGKVSPYVKKQLIQIINNDIGIPEERQKWT